MLDRKIFFAEIRKTLFPGGLTQPQVDGINAVLDEWERRKFTDERWLAYMLATDYHETDKKMQAIREYGRGVGKKYGSVGRNGQAAYGRGLVQLTWDDNYERADKELGLGGALVKNYDLALDLPIAVKIMFGGMIAGWFTGKKLGDYLNGTLTDFVNARRIINGTDKASLIAGHAGNFAAAIKAARVADAPVQSPSASAPIPQPPPPDIPAPKPAPEPPKPEERGFWDKFKDLFKPKA